MTFNTNIDDNVTEDLVRRGGMCKPRQACAHSRSLCSSTLRDCCDMRNAEGACVTVTPSLFCVLNLFIGIGGLTPPNAGKN